MRNEPPAGMIFVKPESATLIVELDRRLNPESKNPAKAAPVDIRSTEFDGGCLEEQGPMWRGWWRWS